MITVNTKEFKKALETVKRGKNPRSSLPVLANVHIRTNKGRLELTTTDLEKSITLYVVADVLEDMETTAPLKEMLAYVSKVKQNKIKIELQGEYLVLNEEVKLPTTGAEEYPPVRTTDMIPNGVLYLDTISRIVHAASTDDTRPVLQGVYITPTSMEATDGFRISMIEGNTGTQKNIIVPASSLNLLLKSTKQTDCKMLLNESRQQLMIKWDEGYIVTMLINGNFPKCKEIVPADEKITVRTTFNRQGLIDGAKVIGAMYNKKDSNVLRMDIGAECKLSNSIHADIPFEKIIPCHTDNPLLVGVNWRYLVDALESFDRETIVIRFMGAKAPMKIDDGRHTEVIMPMCLEEDR